MKTILNELIEIVKNTKPETTDCGADFDKEMCDGCGYYFECLNNIEHHKKCDDLLNKLKVSK